MKRLSFITQFNIEFLLPLTSKVLGKISVFKKLEAPASKSLKVFT